MDVNAIAMTLEMAPFLVKEYLSMIEGSEDY
jgi:hypothetical protein